MLEPADEVTDTTGVRYSNSTQPPLADKVSSARLSPTYFKRICLAP